jgi:hypothetical protein
MPGASRVPSCTPVADPALLEALARAATVDFPSRLQFGL